MHKHTVERWSHEHVFLGDAHGPLGGEETDPMADDLHLIERDLHGEPPDDTETELAVVRAMLAAAVAVIRDVEWIDGWLCPKCEHTKPRHAPGCTLAAVLARAEGRG